MPSYIVKRTLSGLLAIWAASIVIFVVIQLPPGDYVTSLVAKLAADGTPISGAQAEALREQYGLDQPIYIQYVKWADEMLHGNYGMSMEYNQPVSVVIGDRMTLTVILSVAAVLLIWVIALPLGIYSAVKQYSVGDHIATFIAFTGIALPNFLLALVVLYVGYQYFGMRSIGGLFSRGVELAPWNWGKVEELLVHLPLPALILGFAGVAEVMRIMRANLLDELRKPYVITARAKGLSEMRVITKYPVRAALNPFVSTIGYIFPFIVSGSIIVSLVMSLPTVGPLLYEALIAQDVYLAGTILLLLAVLTVVGTLISDLLLMWVDPRIRHGLGGAG